jgi:ABC-2 type transport system permease protein
MIYDIDYLIGIVAMIIKNIVNFGLILLLFHIIENIEGWTFN